MPIYEFVCDDCRREQELLVRGEETPACESCGGGRLTRLLSVPAAHVAGGGSQTASQGPPPGACGGSCSCFPGG